MKVLGREPALIAGALGSVLIVFASSFELSFLTSGQATAIAALLTAVVMAWTTRPAAPAIFTGVVTAGAALLAEYGLNLSNEKIAAVSAMVLAVCALLGVRPHVYPQDTLVSRS